MANLIPFDPIAEMQALQNELFGDWIKPSKTVHMPMTDVFTRDNTLHVEAHLPNFDEKDVNISVDDGALEIQAERHEKEEDKDKKYILRESSSTFYRRLRLPETADEDKIAANFKNGLLQVTVPLKELPKPRKIAIGSGK